MQEIFLGEAMKKRRLELGLTQEQLCDGICEPVTISRLENGKQTPSRRNLNALLGRLAMPTNRYYALLSSKELKIEDLWRQITDCNTHFEHCSEENRFQYREEGLKLHQKLKEAADPDDLLIQQHIICSMVILGKSDGPYTPEEKKKMLIQAMQMTSPSFDISDIGRGLYTTDEIKIINQIAAVSIEDHKHMDAIEILHQLYQYIKKHFSNPAVGHIGLVIYNYAVELYTIGQYQDALELTREGRSIALKHAYYEYLPELIGLAAGCEHALGDDQKSLDLFLQAYYVMKAFGKENSRHYLIEEAKTLLNVDLQSLTFCSSV